MGPDRLFAFILPNSAVIGTYYDQIAASITVAAGAWRGGVYDDNSTAPNNLLGSDTGAITAVADYANHPLTEFIVTTTQLWCAMINNNGTLTMEINGSITNGLKYRDVVYGALPSSWGSVTGTSSNSRRLKISHS